MLAQCRAVGELALELELVLSRELEESVQEGAGKDLPPEGERDCEGHIPSLTEESSDALGAIMQTGTCVTRKLKRSVRDRRSLELFFGL